MLSDTKISFRESRSNAKTKEDDCQILSGEAVFADDLVQTGSFCLILCDVLEPPPLDREPMGSSYGF